MFHLLFKFFFLSLNTREHALSFFVKIWPHCYRLDVGSGNIMSLLFCSWVCNRLRATSCHLHLPRRYYLSSPAPFLNARVCTYLLWSNLTIRSRDINLLLECHCVYSERTSGIPSGDRCVCVCDVDGRCRVSTNTTSTRLHGVKIFLN